MKDALEDKVSWSSYFVAILKPDELGKENY